MESVGEKLRNARLRAGLSLEDISHRTRIGVKSLAAIEADDTETIGSRFFYKSFVFQMANVTGIVRSELEPAFQMAFERIAEPLVPGQPGAPAPPKLSSLKPVPVKASRWFYSVALLVLMLTVCSAVFAYWQDNRTAAVPTAPAHKSQAISAPKNLDKTAPVA